MIFERAKGFESHPLRVDVGAKSETKNLQTSRLQVFSLSEQQSLIELLKNRN